MEGESPALSEMLCNVLFLVSKYLFKVNNKDTRTKFTPTEFAITPNIRAKVRPDLRKFSPFIIDNRQKLAFENTT